MNPDPLVDFLRQYAPTAPPPSPGLEARILNATRPQPRPVWHWFPPALAVAGLSLWLGVASAHLWQPSPAQVAEMEAWVEANWHGSGDELLPLP
ncbi:hypothetical protein LQF76_06925 [Gloeomargaritales cyanobacterium VI4D9]|nr:hypothetical protein LQF76_06925 [Gloeomargaritales cyanobacterium VI4D9]